MQLMYGSGHRPQTSGLSPNLPLTGAKILILRLSSSTSATYTKPSTLAARTTSGLSRTEAFITAKVQCCMSDDGSSVTKLCFSSGESVQRNH
ncbi:hypothetical protein MKX07_003194 [Trichoderma sp. CBMAI-0711]|nr:hypothetical protein MKX07_003194 [Trichoderma sp. CBMAI-0711]